MKKRLLLLLASTLSLVFLTGCITKNNQNIDSEPQFIGGDLIFSEFYVGERYSDRAVELANVGEEAIDLSHYKLLIYRDAGKNPKPTETIELSGTLESRKTFVICYTSANQDIKNKSDLISDDFLNDGTFPMTISDDKGQVVGRRRPEQLGHRHQPALHLRRTPGSG